MLKPFDDADRAEWRKGWQITAGAAIGLGTGASLYAMNASLFITSFTKDFGWTRGDMSVAGACAFIAGAIAVPFIGRALDRWGFRAVALVCVPAIAAVYLGLTQMTGSYAVYVALLVCAGIFGAGTGSMVYTRPVIAAFDRQRGLALGVGACGTSVASIIVAPLLAFVIETYGWRTGGYGLAVVTLLVGLPLSLSLIGRASERRAEETADLPLTSEAPRAVADMTLRQALRDPRFYLLAAALMAVNIPGAGVVGQLAPMITDKGLSESTAGIVMAIYSVGLLTGRLGTGLALDRYPAANVAAITTGIPALGALLLLVPEPSFAIAAIAVALIGLQQGSEIDLLAYFVSRTFGYKNYGTIYGAIAMAGALSTATGLVLFGKLHDATKSYDLALTIGATAFVIGAAAFFAMKYARPATR
jgi:predicted MFS family arabinose efflux permease